MNGKFIINTSTGGRLLCCWDTCDAPGTTLHEVRVAEPTGTAHYVFCRERHRQFWINSHRRNGALPPGFRLSIA